MEDAEEPGEEAEETLGVTVPRDMVLDPEPVPVSAGAEGNASVGAGVKLPVPAKWTKPWADGRKHTTGGQTRQCRWCQWLLCRLGLPG